MTIPRYDEFFVPMLRILSDGKIHASGEMLTLLADEFAVTEGERSRLLPSGRSRVLNGRISWARTYLKKAGLIESPKRGTYRITRPGKEALASGAQIDNLIDGHKLAQLMIEHGFGVSTRKIYEIKAVDSDVFNEYVDEE